MSQVKKLQKLDSRESSLQKSWKLLFCWVEETTIKTHSCQGSFLKFFGWDLRWGELCGVNILSENTEINLIFTYYWRAVTLKRPYNPTTSESLIRMYNINLKCCLANVYTLKLRSTCLGRLEGLLGTRTQAGTKI